MARLGDEAMLDAVGGAAQCEEPCIIGAAWQERDLKSLGHPRESLEIEDF